MKEFPPFRLDAADQALWRDGQRVPLTPKAFAVLNYLVDRAGRLVTQNELLEALWPDTFVQPEVLKSQILDVRAALGDRPREPLFIETVPRRGYRFIAAVRDSAMPPAAPAPAPVSGRLPKLVGRDRALEELAGGLQRASAGERQILFVTGEQGMGKTTVVDAFLPEAMRSGALVARGQCLEGFGIVKEPYYPLLEALGQLARGAASQPLGDILEKQAPTWLSQLPALMKREHRESLQRELMGATRERMIREICEALEAFTEDRTLVLLFEDLHWADPSTVDLIAAIAHRHIPARLAIIGTYRPVDIVLADHPLKKVSQALRAYRLSREVALSPLAEDEVAQYLAQQAGAATSGDVATLELAHWIRRQTEGNPLFMVTVVEHLRDKGHIALDRGVALATPIGQLELSVPDTLRQMIDLQIERLSPREQLTLDAASVHGAVFSTAVIGSALDIDAESVEDTCQKLAGQNQLVRAVEAEQLPDGTLSQRYEFAHAAFRSVCYQRLAPARRAKLHRGVGLKIESLAGGRRAQAAAELARHFEQCGDWPRAVDYLSLAAKNAWQRFAYREAIAILEQALRAAEKLPELERMEAEIRILQSLSVLYQALHEIERAIPPLEELARRAAAGCRPEVELRTLVALAAIRGAYDSRECLSVVERLETLTDEQSSPVAEAYFRAQWATLRITLFGWDGEMAGQNADDSAVAQESPEAVAALKMDRCYLQWLASDYAESVRNAEESLPGLLLSGRLVRYLQGRDLMAMNLTMMGQWGKALDLLDAAMEDARRNDAPLRLAMPLIFKAWVHLAARDFQGARTMCEQALPSLDGKYVRDRRRLALQFAAEASLGLGECEKALEGFARLQAEMEDCPVVLGWYWRIPLLIGLAATRLGMGDVTGARAEANLAIEAACATEERTWQALAWEMSARVAIEEGRNTRAAGDLQMAIETQAEIETPLAAWRVHFTAAQLHRDDPERQRHHLAQGQKVIQSLAASLSGRPALQKVFLSSLPIEFQRFTTTG